MIRLIFGYILELEVILSFAWVGVVFNDFAYKINLHSFGHKKHSIQFRLLLNTSETIFLKEVSPVIHIPKHIAHSIA